MSIFLAIIALNLFSIVGTLKNNGKTEVNKNLCTKFYALGHSKPSKPLNEVDAFKGSNKDFMYEGDLRGKLEFFFPENIKQIFPENDYSPNQRRGTSI